MKNYISAANPLFLTILNGLFDSGRLLTGAFHTFYYLDQGISLIELAYIQIAFSTTVLLLELPTGLFADYYSRKTSTIIACILIATFFPIAFFYTNYHSLVIAHILYAVGMCMFSGASHSWLVDLVEYSFENKSKFDYFSHLSREISSATNVITGISCALIVYKFGFKYIFITSSIIMILLGVLYSFIVHPRDSKKLITNHPQRGSVCEIVSATFFKSKYGLIFLFISGLLVSLYQPLYHYWQPLFLSINDSMKINNFSSNNKFLLLGISFSLLSIVVSLSHYIVRKYFLKFNVYNLSISLSLFISYLFYIFGHISKGDSLKFMIVFCSLHGCLSVMYITITNEFIKSANGKYLSTLLSIRSSVQRLAAIFTLLIIAFFLDYINLGIIISFFSLVALVVAALFWVWSSGNEIIQVVSRHQT